MAQRTAWTTRCIRSNIVRQLFQGRLSRLLCLFIVITVLFGLLAHLSVVNDPPPTPVPPLTPCQVTTPSSVKVEMNISTRNQLITVNVESFNNPWRVDDISLDDSEITMHNSTRCAKNKDGLQLFCGTRFTDVAQGSVLTIGMHSGGRKHQTVVAVQLDLAKLTVHLLFDRPDKRLRVFLFGSEGDADASRWRTKPMGIVNGGRNTRAT